MPRICEGQAGPMAPRSEKTVPRAHGTRFEGPQKFISRQGSEGLGSGAGPLEVSSKSPWDQVLGPWGVSSKSPWDQV